MEMQHLFDIIKFYEEAVSRAKDRIWTITAWLLALNSAIIAFCFKFYVDYPENNDILLFEFIFCMAGIGLCIFSLLLINDH